MKRGISSIILVAGIVLLSGCSLTSPSSNFADSSPQNLPNPNGNIWKSSDGGKTWQVKNKGAVGINFSKIDVLSIAFDPRNENNVLLGTRGGGILKTEDGGENWNFLNFQPEKVYGLAVDPSNGQIVYASGVWKERGKIYKSLDQGNTWDEIYTVPASGPLILYIAIDRKTPGTLYASTSDNQVIRSSDGGQSWKNIFNAPAPVFRIAIDQNNSNLIYASIFDGGLWRSQDGGQVFEDISRNPSSVSQGALNMNDVETDPTHGNWVYAIGKMGILRSKDAGGTWEKLPTLNNPQTFPARTLSVNPGNSQELVYGAVKATYKSVDFGNNWSTFQLDTDSVVNVIRHNPVNPSVVYMGFSARNL